jgi:hypothetical protein
LKRLIALLFALGIPALALAQAPQVPVTGGLGAGGNFPLISSPGLVFTSDAAHTMIYPETSGSSGVIVVTSSVPLTAARNVLVPLTKGFQWTVFNETTGGQTVNFCGATGMCAAVPNDGLPHLVSCDGANYASLASGAVYPGSGVPLSTGLAWGTSYQVGTGANNLVQLNSSAALPAVSGANLSALNGASLQTATVANAALANSATTVNGQTCTLGGSCTVSGGGGYSLGGTLNNSDCAIESGTGITSCSLTGADGSHLLSFTTGSSGAPSGPLVTVTFTVTRGHTTYPILQGAQCGLTSAGGSSTTYIATSSGGLTPSTTYTCSVSAP